MLVESGALHAGAQKVGAAELCRLIELPQSLGLDEFAVLRVQQKRGNAAGHQRAAPDQPGLPDGIRRGTELQRLHGAAQGLQPAQALLADTQNAALHRQIAIEVGQPANLQFRAVKPIECLREVSTVGQRQRHPGIKTGLHCQQLRYVPCRAPHRAFGTQLTDPDIGGRPHRHPALTGAQTKHIVPARRVAQTAHEIRTIGHGQQAQRQRHGSAATAATGGARSVEGIAGDAENFVEGMRAQAKFRRVALANDDAAGALHALHHQAVLLRDKAAHEGRAQCGRNTGAVGQILDRLRHAVHPAQGLPACQLRITRVGLQQQRLRVLQTHECVVNGIKSIDARQVGLHHLAAGNFTRVNRARQGVGSEFGDGHDFAMIITP